MSQHSSSDLSATVSLKSDDDMQKAERNFQELTLRTNENVPASKPPSSLCTYHSQTPEANVPFNASNGAPDQNLAMSQHSSTATVSLKSDDDLQKAERNLQELTLRTNENVASIPPSSLCTYYSPTPEANVPFNASNGAPDQNREDDAINTKDQHYDACFIYPERDQILVDKIIDILTNFVTLNGGLQSRRPSFCTDCSELGTNRLDICDILNRCTCCFIIFNGNAEDDDDEEKLFFKYLSDLALWKRVTKKNAARIIPVIVHKNSKVDDKLDIYTPLRLYKLIPDKPLDDVDVSTLTSEDLNERILKSISSCLEKRKK